MTQEEFNNTKKNIYKMKTNEEILAECIANNESTSIPILKAMKQAQIEAIDEMVEQLEYPNLRLREIAEELKKKILEQS